jgi:dTDP-4-amino-4,6-dideoxygalactose transaminase
LGKTSLVSDLVNAVVAYLLEEENLLGQESINRVKEFHIPFNQPYMTGKELGYISQAHAKAHLAGDGEFTKKCEAWLEQRTGCAKALLTHSCTAALEMAAILTGIQPGDEVIMPSYTFVSTANAFVLRGGVPVFVDIRADTLNIDEALIEEAITPRTKAIAPVHYAGVACEMDAIVAIAERHGLMVIEDAAQGVMSFYKKKSLGGIGNLGCYSFHETKNVISGEGGALLINTPRFVQEAEIIREKGTNRTSFFRGEVDKYTWQSIGSSYLPSELVAAFLWAQLEEAVPLTQNRLSTWMHYHHLLEPLERAELLRCPVIPAGCAHNAHMYYILIREGVNRNKVIQYLKDNGVDAIFHYIPLHSSPAGMRLARAHRTLENTVRLAERLLRLPLWIGITQNQQERVVECLKDILSK